MEEYQCDILAETDATALALVFGCAICSCAFEEAPMLAEQVAAGTLPPGRPSVCRKTRV